MGTSSARRAPTTRLWRLAKAAATRYLSPETAGTVEARQLAARYVAALGEGGGPGLAGALASFRLTRRLAQTLGAFLGQAVSQGWPKALEEWGVPTPPEAPPETLALSLSAAFQSPDGGLEEAAAHTALTGVFLEELSHPHPHPDSAALVRRFLAQALSLRLALDLGESLEAAAPDIAQLQQGLAKIVGEIEAPAAAPLPPAPPPTPEDWQGLAGWTWVTGLLENLLLRIMDPNFT